MVMKHMSNMCCVSACHTRCVGAICSRRSVGYGSSLLNMIIGWPVLVHVRTGIAKHISGTCEHVFRD